MMTFLVSTIAYLLVLSTLLLSCECHNIRKYNAVEFIEMYGYNLEKHFITTKDGYILGFHRIPHGRNQTTANKIPVLVVHGMAASNAYFVSMGPDRSLAYILAESGYDVWLANMRGTLWSKNHTKLLPIGKNPKKFYNFSFHEGGVYDLPSCVDYILNATGQKSLHYICHSQGCSSFLVFASTLPNYNKKIKLASLLAPGTIMEHHTALIKGLTKNIMEFFDELNKLNVYDFPWIEVVQNFGVRNCGVRKEMEVFCRTIFGALSGGVNDEQLDARTMHIFFMNTPHYLSLKQVRHFIQLIHSGGFRPYDYGPERNKQLYGASLPPEYYLKNITAPIALYVAKNDLLVGYENYPKLLHRLPPLARYFEVPDHKFNHVDLVIGKDVKTLLFTDMIRFMKKYD